MRERRPPQFDRKLQRGGQTPRVASHTNWLPIKTWEEIKAPKWTAGRERRDPRSHACCWPTNNKKKNIVKRKRKGGGGGPFLLSYQLTFYYWTLQVIIAQSASEKDFLITSTCPIFPRRTVRGREENCWCLSLSQNGPILHSSAPLETIVKGLPLTNKFTFRYCFVVVMVVSWQKWWEGVWQRDRCSRARTVTPRHPTSSQLKFLFLGGEIYDFHIY